MADVTLSDLTSPARIEPLWRDLEARSGASFFQSWSWIGCWLSLLPEGVEPQLLEMRAGGKTLGLGILTPSRRLGVLRRLYLNAGPDPASACIAIEHNGILAAGSGIAGAALAWLAGRPGWDELVLPGVPEAYGDLARGVGLAPIVGVTAQTHIVDLHRLRDDPFANLSRNSRQQLRRALREAGKVTVRQAETLGEAHAFLDGLKALHQAHWRRRGLPGAFAAPAFESFHRRLVDGCLSRGEIQLLRFSADGEPFGYLYNLIRDGRVYSYQSGFAAPAGRHAKPAMVAHHLAMRLCLERDLRIYDLLAGSNQLKASLATRTEPLIWASLLRNGMIARLREANKEVGRALKRGLFAGFSNRITPTC